MVDGLRARRVVVGVLAWAVFALSWWSAARGGVQGALAGMSLLVLSCVGALVVTLAWQAHNKAIYRRRGARRSAARQDQPWESDRLGHRLDFGDGLATASEVVVASADGVKTYRATA